MKTLMIFLLFVSAQSFAASNVAKVIVFKGKVLAISKDNKETLIKKGEWLREGTRIKTSPKSFVRLKFIDKSQMNVGPDSEVKIEKFSKEKAGVISVLKGQLRSKVSKDYLQMEEGKSKLFVKSKNAVMGIRGTDFDFIVGKNDAVTAILYEGSVYFNKMEAGASDLESVVSRGVAIRPGEFSVVNQAMTKPTIPSKMNRMQFHKLKKNSDFKRSPDNQVEMKTKKVRGVPPGLKAAAVSNTHKEISDKVGAVTKIEGQQKIEAKVDMESARGFVRGDDIKPTAGSAVDIEKGIIIPPSIDANFDSNLEVFVDNSNIRDDGGVNTEMVKSTTLSTNPIVNLPSGEIKQVIGSQVGDKVEGMVKEQIINNQQEFVDPGKLDGSYIPQPPPTDSTAIGGGGYNIKPRSRVQTTTTNGN